MLIHVRVFIHILSCVYKKSDLSSVTLNPIPSCSISLSSYSTSYIPQTSVQDLPRVPISAINLQFVAVLGYLGEFGEAFMWWKILKVAQAVMMGRLVVIEGTGDQLKMRNFGNLSINMVPRIGISSRNIFKEDQVR